jgi:hypothetical protein
MDTTEDHKGRTIARIAIALGCAVVVAFTVLIAAWVHGYDEAEAGFHPQLVNNLGSTVHVERCWSSCRPGGFASVRTLQSGQSLSAIAHTDSSDPWIVTSSQGQPIGCIPLSYPIRYKGSSTPVVKLSSMISASVCERGGA